MPKNTTSGEMILMSLNFVTMNEVLKAIGKLLLNSRGNYSLTFRFTCHCVSHNDEETEYELNRENIGRLLVKTIDL